MKSSRSYALEALVDLAFLVLAPVQAETRIGPCSHELATQYGKRLW